MDDRSLRSLVWQPIETAPKDKTVVLFGRAGEDYADYLRAGYLANVDGEWCAKILGTYYSGYTHWMPLPTEPQASDSERSS